MKSLGSDPIYPPKDKIMLATKEGVPITNQRFVDSGEEFIMPSDTAACADLLYWADSAMYWVQASQSYHTSKEPEDVLSRAESLQTCINHIGIIVIKAMIEHGVRIATREERNNAE